MIESSKNYKYSLLSAINALVAFVLVAIGVEGYKNNDQVNGVFWPYLVKLFSYFKSDKNYPKINETPIFPLTDESIIKLFICLGIILALISIYSGFLAKNNKENSLYYACSITLSLVAIIYSLPLVKIIF